MTDFMGKSLKQGGIHAYETDVCHVYRGSEFKFVVKMPVKKGGQPQPHVFGADGETLWFNEFVKYHVEYEGLEMIVDF